MAIALDETNILVAVHFTMEKHLPAKLSRAFRREEQRRRQPITLVDFWRLRDVRHVSPRHKTRDFRLQDIR